MIRNAIQTNDVSSIVESFEDLTTYFRDEINGYHEYCYTCGICCLWVIKKDFNYYVNIYEDWYDNRDYEIMTSEVSPGKHSGPYCKVCAIDAKILNSYLD